MTTDTVIAPVIPLTHRLIPNSGHPPPLFPRKLLVLFKQLVKARDPGAELWIRLHLALIRERRRFRSDYLADRFTAQIQYTTNLLEGISRNRPDFEFMDDV